jgi:hypothetical protein
MVDVLLVLAQQFGHTSGHSRRDSHSVRPESLNKTRKGDGFLDRRLRRQVLAAPAAQQARWQRRRFASSVVRRARRLLPGSAAATDSTGLQELTDGMFVVARRDGREQVVTVFEMKSPSSLRDLARRKSKKIELAEEQALGKAFKKEASCPGLRTTERAADTTGRQGLSACRDRDQQAGHGVACGDAEGQRLSKLQTDRIRAEPLNFVQVEQSIRDEVLNAVAERLLTLVNP